MSEAGAVSLSEPRRLGVAQQHARDNDHRRLVTIIEWFITTTVDRRNEILVRRFCNEGFVQQHILHATAHTGASMAMRVCTVIKVGTDGLIIRIDEYFDPAEMAPLLLSGSS